MLDLIGQHLARFQILEYLGQNKVCEIYKANDPKLDRLVVIEVLRPQFNEVDDVRLNFLKLARAAVRWRHPNIVRYYDYGHAALPSTPHPLPYIVREYLLEPGMDQLLRDMRENGLWISLYEGVQITRQVCSAIDYLHKRGISHGELKPANILVKPETTDILPHQPILISPGYYGLTTMETPTESQRESQTDKVDSTSTDTLKTTTFENKNQTTLANIQHDIFGIGLLLYELAVGQLPIAVEVDELEGHTRAEHFQNNWPSPRILRPDLPVSLERIITKALAADPADSYMDARSLNKDLFDILPEAQQVKTPPPGIQEAASLAFVIQNQVIPDSNDLTPLEPLHPSISAPEISLDTIHIISPDNSVQTISMTVEGLVIGRDPENDIVVDHPGVSRYHARLDFDAGNYQITDLNSTNGTFLEDARLFSNTPSIWQPGENLRVGQTWLRLERAGQDELTIPSEPKGTQSQAATPVLQRFDGSVIDPAMVKYSSGAGNIGFVIDTPNLSVIPGSNATAQLILFNRSDVADLFRITVEGIPPEWIAGQFIEIDLAPHGQREVHLTFQPSRSPESRAGRRSVKIKISSQRDPAQFVLYALPLTIAAYSHFTGDLFPTRSDINEPARVVVHNLGNLPETFTIFWEDSLRTLNFYPPEAKLTIPQGKSTSAEFLTTEVSPRWFGGDRTYRFSAVVRSPSGLVQTFTGEKIGRGKIPPWVPAVILPLCMILACFTFFIFSQSVFPPQLSNPTEIANQTSIAQMSLATDQAKTATARAPSIEENTAAEAATATAIWLTDDMDHDGLTNNQELQLGTNPGMIDTDEDGLTDGQEVSTWKTYPLTPDTDGDGLKDGEEVQRGTNPLKRDTDGDGIDDANDPNPIRVPTTTPMPSSTPIPTLTLPRPTNTSMIPTATQGSGTSTTDLIISVSNEQSYQIPGTNVVYTIIVKNDGPNPVTGAQVIDLFPNTLLNMLWTCNGTAGSRCSAPSGNGTINTTVDLSTAGTVTFIANGAISPVATGILLNTASVTVPSSVTDSNNVNNVAMDTDALTPKAALSLNMTDNLDEVGPGQPTSYTIIASNNGPSAVDNITIIDTFPPEIQDITWSCTPSSESSCETSGAQSGNIDTTLSLNPGGTAAITANGTVREDAAGNIINTTHLTSPIDPDTNNQSATDTTLITSKTDLTLDIVAPTSVISSTVLTYTVVITNSGPAGASDVILTSILPEGMLFLSANQIIPSTGAVSCVDISGEVTCALGALPASLRSILEFTIIAPVQPGSISIQVAVKANEPDVNPADNQTTFQVQIN